MQVRWEALPQPDWSLQKATVYKPPRNSLEMEVQLIWQAVIGRDSISIDANYSSVGGNMMHAIIINAVLRYGLSMA